MTRVWSISLFLLALLPSAWTSAAVSHAHEDRRGRPIIGQFVSIDASTSVKVRAKGPCWTKRCWAKVHPATIRTPLHSDDWLYLKGGNNATLRFNGTQARLNLGTVTTCLGVFDARDRALANDRRLAGGCPTGVVDRAADARWPRRGSASAGIGVDAAASRGRRVALVLQQGQLLATLPAGMPATIYVAGSRVTLLQPGRGQINQVNVAKTKSAAVITAISGVVKVLPFSAQAALSLHQGDQVTARNGELSGTRTVDTTTVTAWLRSVPPALQRSVFTAGEVGIPYREQEVIGGRPPYRWTVGGTLPPGLTFSENGYLVGVPRRAGVYPITVTIKDAHGLATTARVTISIKGPPTISTQSVPPGEVDLRYPQTKLEAASGIGPYTWTGTVVDCQAKDCFPLNLSSGGVLSGTPGERAVGDLVLGVTVTDIVGGQASAHYTITIYPPVRITTSKLTFDCSGKACTESEQLEAAGGLQPYTWSIVKSSVPLNLSDSGLLTLSEEAKKVIAAGGSFSVTVQVTDSLGGTSQVPYTVNPGFEAIRLAAPIH